MGKRIIARPSECIVCLSLIEGTSTLRAFVRGYVAGAHAREGVERLCPMHADLVDEMMAGEAAVYGSTPAFPKKRPIASTARRVRPMSTRVDMMPIRLVSGIRGGPPSSRR
jgi:hypothetical protein